MKRRDRDLLSYALDAALVVLLCGALALILLCLATMVQV